MKTKYITYKGKTLTAKEWETKVGMPSKLICDRLLSGWSVERALTEPVKQTCQKLYRWEGKKRTVRELATIRGVGESTMRQRLRKMSLKEAMAMPNSRPQRRERIKEQEKPKKVVKQEEKRDYTQCKTCIYREKDMTCGYSTVTGRCRLGISPPSPNCTVYKKGKPIVQKAVLERMRKGAII